MIMTKRLLLIMACVGCMMPMLGQVRKDSVPGREDRGLSEQEIQSLVTPIGTPREGELPKEVTPMRASDIAVNPLYEMPQYVVPEMSIQVWPKGSRLPRWATGYMYGYNAQSSSLLYGYTAVAGMGVSQQLGRYWTVSGGLDLSKYSVHYNTAMVNGSVTWHPNRYFSTTVFANYTRSFLSPVNLGPSFEWGGYVTLQTDTDLPFGIDAGVRNDYDPVSGHWVTPIVQPFIKIGDAKLGIDMGPMIQNAIQRASGKGGGHDAGPGLIPKPMKAMPQVAPRR